MKVGNTTYCPEHCSHFIVYCVVDIVITGNTIRINRLSLHCSVGKNEVLAQNNNLSEGKGEVTSRVLSGVGNVFRKGSDVVLAFLMMAISG